MIQKEENYIEYHRKETKRKIYVLYVLMMSKALYINLVDIEFDVTIVQKYYGNTIKPALGVENLVSSLDVLCLPPKSHKRSGAL